MTTATTPPVPLPAGAVAIDNWEGELPSRSIQGNERHVLDHTAFVWTGGCQFLDGSVAVTPDYMAPSINVELAEGLNSDQARQLASALLEAAAEVDGWVQQR